MSCKTMHICEMPRIRDPHDVPHFVVLLSSHEAPQGRGAFKSNIMSQNVIF